MVRKQRKSFAETLTTVCHSRKSSFWGFCFTIFVASIFDVATVSVQFQHGPCVESGVLTLDLTQYYREEKEDRQNA